MNPSYKLCAAALCATLAIGALGLRPVRAVAEPVSSSKQAPRAISPLQWSGFVAQTMAAPSTNLSAALKVDLSQAQTSAAFAQVMAATGLSPSAVLSRPAAEQAQIIREAMSAYAESLLHEAAKPSAAAVPTGQLEALQRVAGALSEPQRLKVKVTLEHGQALALLLAAKQHWQKPELPDVAAAGQPVAAKNQATLGKARPGAAQKKAPAIEPEPPAPAAPIENEAAVAQRFPVWELTLAEIGHQRHWLGPVMLARPMAWLVDARVPILGGLAARWLVAKFAGKPAMTGLVGYLFPDKVMGALRSGYPALSDWAVQQLSGTEARDNLDEQLAYILKHESDLRIRANAIKAMGLSLPDEAQALLAAHLQGRDAAIRRLAAARLARQQALSPAAQEALKQVLADSDAHVRVHAIIGLSGAHQKGQAGVQPPSPRQTEDLIAYWRQADDATQTSIVRTLASSDSLPEAAVRFLFEVGATHDIEASWNALAMQATLPDALREELLKRIEASVAKKVALFGGPADFFSFPEALFALQHSDFPGLSRQAAHYLAGRRSQAMWSIPGIEKKFISALEGPRRLNALVALGAQGALPDRVTETVLDLMKDPAVAIRSEATHVIMHRLKENIPFGDAARITAALETAARDESFEVRLAASIALSFQGRELPPGLYAEVIAARKEQDPAVRKYVSDALERLPTLGGPILEAFTKDLSDPDEAVRRHAIDALWKSPRPSPAQYEVLAQALMSADAYVKKMAYESLMAHRELMPHVFPPLVQAVNSKDSVASRSAAELLAKADALPDSVYQGLLAGLEQDATDHRLQGLWIVMHSRRPPEFMQKALLRILESNPAFRLGLLAIVEDWTPPLELLSALYPGKIGELSELIPSLSKITRSHGFSRSRLATLESVQELLDQLRELRRTLTPEDYAALISSYSDLQSIAPKALVEPSRSAYQAEEYFVPYPVPGLAAKNAPFAPVFASIHLGTVSGAHKLLATSFEAFESLIDSNFQALEMLAKNAGAIDKKTGQAILEHAGRMVASYELLADSKNSLFRDKLDAIRADLERLWADLPDGAKLPKEIARRVTELEAGMGLPGIRNLHTFINYLHQKSFSALAQAAGNAHADGSIVIGPKTLSLLDLSVERPMEKGRITNPLLRLVASPHTPRGTLILRDDQLWLHARLGAHSVQIHVKLAEPDEGGFLQVRYSEGSHDAGNKRRLVYLSEILRLFGAEAQVQGGQYLNLSWDKDHGLLSKSQLEHILPRLLRAFGESVNIDLHLQKIKSRDKSEHLARTMAATHVAHGHVPFVGRDLENLYEKYRSQERGRAKVRETLNRELERLRLPGIPVDLTFGQEVLDERFSAPIRLALARGELFLNAQALPERAAYRPVADLAQEVGRAPARASQVAAALSAADLAESSFETIGAVGRLRAQRAQWLWGDHGIVVYALRDPQSRAVAYAAAQAWDGASLRPLDAQAFMDVLKRRGIDVSAGVPSSRIQEQRWRRMLASAPIPALSLASARGIAASGGRGGVATGPAAFRKERGVERQGIFIAPYTTPDDLEYMRQSAGVVTTGGGLLSHAAITTRELGIPAVILNDARWIRAQDEDVLEIDVEQPGQAVPGPGGVWIVDAVERRRLRIRDGDVVRVDGERGTVTSFDPPDAANAAEAAAVKREIRESQRLMAAIESGRGKVAALGARLGRLRGPPRAAAGRFIFEEALWNPAFVGYRAQLIATVLDSDKNLRRELQEYGARFLKTQLAQLEHETEPDQEVSQSDVARLKARLATLAALTDALRLDRAALRTLETRLAELQSLSQTIARRAVEAMEAAGRAWAQRIDELQTADLPALRSFLRRVTGTDLEGRLAAMQARATELTRQKKRTILLERPSLIPLAEVDDDFTDLVGGKSAKLGEIMRVVASEGGDVPPGVALTTEAYLRFLRESGLEREVLAHAKELDDFLSRADLDQPKTLRHIREQSARIQALIKSASLDAHSGLGREILESLSAHGLDQSLFAVRSSAVQEDGQEAAFAGAAETSLYVDAASVLEKVVDNWASFWLPRGIQYRWQQGVSSVDLRPAVTIQKMADAQAAGVMFTVDPVTGRRDVMINAAFGQGEGVVSGLVQADQYLANRDGEEIAPVVLGTKKVMVVRKAEGRGTQARRVPAKERRLRSLTPEQVRELVRIGVALEDHFGYPLDIEFAMEEGRVVILQARPVTTGRRQGAAMIGDFSSLMSFYLAQALSGLGDDSVAREALSGWTVSAKQYLLSQSREASIERIYRIADRIVNLNPQAGAGPREWTVDSRTKKQVKLIESAAMARHDWLKQKLAHAAEGKAQAGMAIASPEDLLRFYKEISSPDLKAIYPRGSNNEAWLEIARAVSRLERAQGAAEVRHAIDHLRNKVHNTGRSFLEYAPDAGPLIQFFDLTRRAKNGEDLDFAARFADRDLAARFRTRAR